MNLQASIKQLTQRNDLDLNQCQQALDAILNNQISALQKAAFLVLLRAKPETAEELTIIVNYLRQKMLTVYTPHKVLDIVGTGGDGAKTVNISTGSAILAASCGVKVAKHGNRSVSSQSGSADVLEALGISIDMVPEKISACIDEVGIGFCFSPLFHPAMSEIKTIRKELNVPTTFNILGPLLNPARADHYLLGVFDPRLVSIIAKVLQNINVGKSIVMHGHGLDEISCVGPCEVIEISSSDSKKFIIDPEFFGFERCSLEDLQGGNAYENAELLMNVFAGKQDHKSKSIANTLILNTAVSFYLYGHSSSIEEAIPYIKENLHSGSAYRLIKKWIEFSHD